MAPATKYGANSVACHPGTIAIAKSQDTTLCTESTSGDARAYSFLRHPVARSRTAAMSGINPMIRKTVETVKYVPMANSSQMSGDLKLGHRPRSLGYGISQ